MKFLKVLKFYENFDLKKKINFIILNCFEIFENLIGRLAMKSGLWLDNVETPNRQ